MAKDKSLARRGQTEVAAHTDMVGLAELDELFDDSEFAGHWQDAACRSDLISGLTDIRCAMHLSQKKVAKAMGTSQSAVSDLEGGATDPRLSTVQRYARAVGASLHIGVVVPTGLSCEFSRPDDRYVVSVNVVNVPSRPDADYLSAGGRPARFFYGYDQRPIAESDEQSVEAQARIPL